MNHSLDLYGAAELAAKIRNREVTADSVVRHSLERIETVQKSCQAFISVSAEQALAVAASIDNLILAGQPVGQLAGVPFAVKDNLATAGIRTTCGSRILADFVPLEDATAVSRLKNAGAILMAKTNLDEFAMGSDTSSSAFGPSRNPWDLQRVPGGSSGGSAIAVATNCVSFALGSDTGGSVRQPAAWCGVSGIKPTWGAISRRGLVAYASSLDQIGVMARRAGDLREILKIVAGPDPADATTRPSLPTGSQAPLPDVKTLRIGWCPQHFELADPAGNGLAMVHAAIQSLAEWTSGVQQVQLQYQELLPAVYYIIAMSEASSNLCRFDGVRYTSRWANPDDGLEQMYSRTRGEGFGDEVRRRILLGTFALSAGSYDQYFVQASRVRRLLRDDLLKAFQSVDVLALPTAPHPAPLSNETLDPVAGYQADQFTVAANLSGCPALSMPCGFSANGLPVGMQLMAAPDGEDRLMALASVWQAHTDWHLRRPPT